MIINIEAIEKLIFEEKYSIYKIAKACNIPSRSSLNKARNTQKIDNLTLETVKKLQNFINEERNKMKFTGVVNLDVAHDAQIAETESLKELLDILEDDADSYKKEVVEYLIYVGNEEEMEDDDFWSETNYFISYVNVDGKYRVNELTVEGLEFNGEKIREFEDYKVLFDNFDGFVDDVVYDLEYEYGIEETPAYAELEEPALTLLKNGRINDAREQIKHEILEFNDMD